jgi:lambda family phage minor tail protein L
MTYPTDIVVELQKLSPSSIIELFELDLFSIGGIKYYFHAGTNGLKQSIRWKGITYSPYPVEVSGFEFTGKGQLPRPRMVVSNISGAISILLLTYDDLLGAKVTRRRTMAKYLDAANFTGGVNPDADPTAEFPDDIYYVEHKISENKQVVELELAASFDLQGVKIPRRQIIQNICPWRYKGTECGYAGTLYFTANDVPTTLANDVCGKNLSSCELRFGTTAQLPYGGFPAAALTK